MERRVLGRGLDALIPSMPDSGNKEVVRTLKVVDVKASKFQPRLHFSDEKIQELAQSIKEKGVIQPILVRSHTDGSFELIAGERRLRAVKFLGLTEIPAIVRRVSDADLLELSIIENVQREELNCLEEAKAYQRLAQEFNYSQDQIAEKVGKNKSSVSNLLRILNLPTKVQDYISQNLITFGHAKALISAGDEARQVLLCEEIVLRGLSVRQIEAILQPANPNKKAKIVKPADRDVQALENALQVALSTKVRIRHQKKRGKIEIEYYSLEDLERLTKIMGVKSY